MIAPAPTGGFSPMPNMYQTMPQQTMPQQLYNGGYMGPMWSCHVGSHISVAITCFPICTCVSIATRTRAPPTWVSWTRKRGFVYTLYRVYIVYTCRFVENVPLLSSSCTSYRTYYTWYTILVFFRRFNYHFGLASRYWASLGILCYPLM